MTTSLAVAALIYLLIATLVWAAHAQMIAEDDDGEVDCPVWVGVVGSVLWPALPLIVSAYYWAKYQLPKSWYYFWNLFAAKRAYRAFCRDVDDPDARKAISGLLANLVIEHTKLRRRLKFSVRVVKGPPPPGMFPGPSVIPADPQKDGETNHEQPTT